MASREEFEAAGLLDPRRAGHDRLDLLVWLDELGFTIDEMRAADLSGDLPGLAGDRRMLPGPLCDREAAMRRSGLAPDDFEAVVTALGFIPVSGAPRGDIGFTDREIGLLAAIATLSSMFSREEALGFVRVLGSSFGRIGEALVSMFLADVESKILERGEGELVLARKVHEAVGLLDALSDELDPILRRHVRQATERTRRATIEDERLRQRFAVGFVDLVGFTERTNHMTPPELATFTREFEGRAHDVALARGARVVKLIGDEVMFVAADPANACRSAGALMAAFGGVGEPVLPRGGLAYGEVLTRGGNYYGSVVNLASRLVDQAVPGEVLATREVVEVAGSSCDFEPAGRRLVKGFREPVGVWALHPGGDG